MSNSINTGRNDLVQILSHANGTFDVLYNTPERYETGWGNLIAAILVGVCTHIANKDGLVENACFYRDQSDLKRAQKFMEEVTTRFPMLGLSADLSENFSTRPIDAGVLNLGWREDEDIEQLSMSIQSILLSGSVLTNPVENSRGLVTVTAKFGEEILKVRLTGIIPQSIAEVLRQPYEYVTGEASSGFQRTQRNNSKPVRETSNKQTVEQYSRASMVADLKKLRDQVNAVLNNLLEEESQKIKEQSHADDFKQSVKKTHDVEVARGQKSQERRKKEVREYQKKVENITTETQQQQPEQKVYPRGQTSSIFYTDDFGYSAQVDATVAHQHCDTGVTTDTTTVMTESGHIAEVPVKPKRVKNDGVKSAFADKLASALKLRSDSPDEQELVALDTALEHNKNKITPLHLSTDVNLACGDC